MEGYVKVKLTPSQRQILIRINSIDNLNKFFTIEKIETIIDRVYYLMIITGSNIINKEIPDDIGLDDLNFYTDLFEKNIKKDNKLSYWESYDSGPLTTISY